MMSRRRSEATEDQALFGRLYPELRRFANVARAPGMEPDDLVQEALARTLSRRSLASLDDPGAYLRVAIVRLASNASRSRERALRRERRVAATDATTDVYPSDLDLLTRVPVRARAVLYLTIVEGASYREAADQVGCSEQAARALAARARRDLRLERDEEHAKETT